MRQTSEKESGEDLSPFMVGSRRQIIAVLRSLNDRKQLVRLLINHGMDAVMTSILEVDDVNGQVLIDCAPNASMNQRILASENVEFESSLDSIRILFSTAYLQECLHDGLPAFTMPVPDNMLRLQRREYYRVPTPITNPVRCTIKVGEDGAAPRNLTLPLQNVSGGGLALVDDSKQLDNAIGRIYRDCRIDLPGGISVVTTLEVRNSMDINRGNGKTSRRVGCLFVDPPSPALAAIQRYITKLEREQNARNNGLA